MARTERSENVAETGMVTDRLDSFEVLPLGGTGLGVRVHGVGRLRVQGLSYIWFWYLRYTFWSNRGN